MTSLELAPQSSSKSPTVSALLSITIALIAVSFAAIFIRFSEEDLGANGTVFNRFLIFVVVVGGSRIGSAVKERWFPRTLPSSELLEPSPEALSRQSWILLASVGVISTLSLTLWALSLTQTTVANSVLLNNLTPLFTSVGGWLFLGKRFDRQFLTGMVIALVGAIALGVEDFQVSGEHAIGDGYALLSAVFLGIYFLVAEQLRGRFTATTILLWRCSIGCILLLPIVVLTEGKVFPTTLSAWLAVLGLGLVCEGVGQRLLAASMDQLSSGFISLFLLLEPIVSAALAWLIFAEGLSVTSLFAFGVVLVGIYLAKSSHSSNQSTPETSPQ